MKRLYWIPVLSIAVAAVFAAYFIYGASRQPTVKVGILFSLTGPMAQTEKPLVDAALFAVEEVNAAGGLLGRTIEPVVVDGKSDWEHFAREADRLITEEKVAALFACWTSSCRKSLKPVVERHNHLLLYPLQYEGLEYSKNIFYTGAVPNQQIIPAVAWGIKTFGPRIFLVGSDYIFPRTANLIIREMAAIRGATVVKEVYLPLGSDSVSSVVGEIKRLKPDFVLNTINGDTTRAFFAALKKEGLTAKTTPVISTSIAEAAGARYPELMKGHYAAWSYFQSIDSPRNRKFTADFAARFGKDRPIGGPMEAVYVSVLLWSHAVEDATSFDAERVGHALLRQSLNAPQGIVSVDPDSHNLWHMARIGRSRADGQFDIVWSSGMPVPPSPFPKFHTPAEWLTLASGGQ